jgi:guanylate kinase
MNNREIDQSSEKQGLNVIDNRGQLFIISAPSGAGKTTLRNAVQHQLQDLLYSVSYTTRKPRRGEKDGDDYYFITRDDFLERVKQNKWAEWAEVHGNLYGTSAEFLEKNLSSGKDILIDIDVQGTFQILERYPDSVTIFIMPPSLDTLRTRLQSRGTDSKDVMAKRLADAEKEMEKRGIYRHIIVNDKLSSAVFELVSIISKYRSGNNSIV